MFSMPKLLLLLAIVVVVFGASRLADIGSGLGKGIKNFRDSLKDKDEDPSKSLKDPRDG
jgi:sec-independent protein translocase protein TatA